MDIDDIFKRPPLPKGSTKRKFEMPAIPSVEESLSKVPKLDTPSVAPKAKGRAAVIEDVSDDEDEDAPDEGDFAPGGDADYFEEEDEDGRFFGGGLSTVQKQVLNIMDHGKDDGLSDGQLTVQGVKKQLLALEKAINKNRDMRTRFGNDPEKFVDSEFALTEALNALLLLSSSPTLSYPVLIELSTPASLSDLLSHENIDVVISVVEVLEDWTDEEVLDVDEAEIEEGMEQEAERRRDSMRALVEALVEAGTVEMIVSGIERFDEEDETERAGVFHTLGLIENLLNLLPSLATSLFSPKSPLLSFLFTRIAKDKLGPEFDQNRFYAGELLSILVGLPVDGVAEARERIGKEEKTDLLLKILSVYRRRDPSSSDEVEFMENVFDTLCSALSSPLVQGSFYEGEGVELMCLMLKEKKLSRTRAVKTLDYAMQGTGGRAAVEKFVDCLGLKYLGAIFMGKAVSGKNSKSASTHEDLEHILSIFASLFTSLPSDSEPRIRLLSKFVENDYEKVDRLLELREDVEERVEKKDDEDDDEEEPDEDEKYIRKLEKGLFSLQLIDYIIAWLCMEDDGVRDHILMLLSRRSQSLSDVMRVLIEYHDNIGDAAVPDDGGKEDGEEEKELTASEEQREILSALLTYLQSLVDTTAS